MDEFLSYAKKNEELIRDRGGELMFRIYIVTESMGMIMPWLSFWFLDEAIESVNSISKGNKTCNYFIFESISTNLVYLDLWHEREQI